MDTGEAIQAYVEALVQMQRKKRIECVLWFPQAVNKNRNLM